MKQDRAWQFVHPDFDQSRVPPGLQTTSSGAIGMVSDEACVRQAILLLLSTRPGERVMRPDYGAELHRLMYSPNDRTTAGLAIHYVRQALVRWEPRVEIVHLDALPSEDIPGRLDIDLTYRLKRSRQEGQILMPLDLTGAPH
jgi:phage baseplate assembly protein W